MPDADRHPAAPCLESLANLSALIRSTAMRSEQRGRLDQNLVAELKEHRFFRLWIPRTYDGDEMPLPAACQVFEAAAYEDGATGWTIMIGAGGGLFGATMEPPAAREIFGDPLAVIAGSGNPTGTARQVETGYRVDGRWHYASGAHHATWFTANTIVHEAGQPVRDSAGAPVMRAMAFPADGVEIIPAWDVTGMRATGSDDFVVRDRYVPAYRSFDVFGELREDGPLYRYPFMSLTELSVAAVALGIGRRALDEWAAFANAKLLLGGGEPLAAQPHAATRFAEATATLSAARAFWSDQLTTSWANVERGGSLDDAELANVRLAAYHAAQGTRRAIDVLREISGMSPLFDDSAFGRCWRDAHAVSQHMVVSPAVLEPSGRALLQRDAG